MEVNGRCWQAVRQNQVYPETVIASNGRQVQADPRQVAETRAGSAPAGRTATRRQDPQNGAENGRQAAGETAGTC